MQNQSSSFTGFFGSTRRGYAAAADSSAKLCASNAQSLAEEPLHNKIVTATHGRRRQASAASVSRIVAPPLCRAADLSLLTRSPDRSATYYHDAPDRACFSRFCYLTSGVYLYRSVIQSDRPTK